MIPFSLWSKIQLCPLWCGSHPAFPTYSHLGTFGVWDLWHFLVLPYFAHVLCLDHLNSLSGLVESLLTYHSPCCSPHQVCYFHFNIEHLLMMLSIMDSYYLLAYPSIPLNFDLLEYQNFFFFVFSLCTWHIVDIILKREEPSWQKK